MRTLPEPVQQVYDKWYHGSSHNLLFFWERDDTYYLVTSIKKERNIITTEGARIFGIQSKYHISVDYTKDTTP